MKKIHTGAILDPRPKEEKKKDWNAKELLGFAPVVDWEEKKNWKSYTERNQKSTSSCVPQSVAKLLEVNEAKEGGNIVFSASKSYAMRSNEGEGSYLQEMLKYAVDPAYYTTEARIKSQGLASDMVMESTANLIWDLEDVSIAKKYAGKSYLEIDLNIDTVAFWVKQGYAVATLFYFTSKEWGQKYPKIIDTTLTTSTGLRHCVAVVDFGLVKGKKYLKIEDSAHFGGRSSRWVSEDFFNKRCFGAGFIFDKPNEEPITLPFVFKKIMRYGETSSDVKFLQEKLKVLGYFPLNITSSGYYGEITRSSVDKFQRENNVASIIELNIVKGRIVGWKTIKKLNDGSKK